MHIQIDFDKWMHEEDLQDEARDILEDYPNLYNKVKAEETGSVLKRKLLSICSLSYKSYCATVFHIEFLYNILNFYTFLIVS